MNKEEKDLLLRDLCARLPYGVIVKDRNGVHKLTPGNTEFIDLFTGKVNIAPYLRPMSSMTEEEIEIFIDYLQLQDEDVADCDFKYSKSDWLLSKHFDYRGLIEKGLAIKVTKENNPYKEN